MWALGIERHRRSWRCNQSVDTAPSGPASSRCVLVFSTAPLLAILPSAAGTRSKNTDTCAAQALAAAAAAGARWCCFHCRADVLLLVAAFRPPAGPWCLLDAMAAIRCAAWLAGLLLLSAAASAHGSVASSARCVSFWTRSAAHGCCDSCRPCADHLARYRSITCRTPSLSVQNLLPPSLRACAFAAALLHTGTFWQTRRCSPTAAACKAHTTSPPHPTPSASTAPPQAAPPPASAFSCMTPHALPASLLSRRSASTSLQATWTKSPSRPVSRGCVCVMHHHGIAISRMQTPALHYLILQFPLIPCCQRHVPGRRSHHTPAESPDLALNRLALPDHPLQARHARAPSSALPSTAPTTATTAWSCSLPRPSLLTVLISRSLASARTWPAQKACCCV